MDINFNIYPLEPLPAPKQDKPSVGFSANDVRKIFLANQDFFNDLVKFGYSEEDASKFILSHCKKI
jgi:hypothetical protein